MEATSIESQPPSCGPAVRRLPAACTPPVAPQLRRLGTWLLAGALPSSTPTLPPPPLPTPQPITAEEQPRSITSSHCLRLFSPPRIWLIFAEQHRGVLADARHVTPDENKPASSCAHLQTEGCGRHILTDGTRCPWCCVLAFPEQPDAAAPSIGGHEGWFLFVRPLLVCFSEAIRKVSKGIT